MDALPDSISAIGRLDWTHLVFIWLVIMSVQLSPMLRRGIARICNAAFKTKFNTNGVSAEAAMQKAVEVQDELVKHDAKCDARHTKIQSDISDLKESASSAAGKLDAIIAIMSKGQ